MRGIRLGLAALLSAATAFADESPNTSAPAPVQAPAALLNKESSKKEEAPPAPVPPAPASETPEPKKDKPPAETAAKPASAPGETSTEVPLQAAVPDAAKDFERAQSLFDKGEEQQAFISLTDFLRRYPEHEKAIEAQFFVGELLFRQRKFAESITEFSKVRAVIKHPRAASAALRIGECWQRLGKIDSARIEWNAVARRYRGTPQAEQAHVLLKGLP